MKEIIAIFVGGGSGSLFRYFFGKWIVPFSTPFPFSTFLSNLVACVIFGVVTGLAYQKIEMNETYKRLVLTGFCGGLSTFSTFNFEMFHLIKSGNIAMALLYLVLSIVVCFIGFWGAMEVCK